jgi:hypothetical protein
METSERGGRERTQSQHRCADPLAQIAQCIRVPVVVEVEKRQVASRCSFDSDIEQFGSNVKPIRCIDVDNRRSRATSLPWEPVEHFLDQSSIAHLKTLQTENRFNRRMTLAQQR